jgi:hypothetical protein
MTSPSTVRGPAGLLLVLATLLGCNGPPGPRDGGVPDSATCSPACGEARTCCGGACVNTANDPRHCGACGAPCREGTYCTGGKCEPRPCTTTCPVGTTCCDGACCGAGQLCCDPQGPIDRGPACVAPDASGTCPQGCAPLCICASPDTPIATPAGERPIASLRVGDLVYSADQRGVIVVPIARTHRTPVSQHQVVRVTLASGAVLEISAGHPTADGRTFADLRPQGALDHVAIRAVERVPYAHLHTYDILPASESGAYFAGGVLIGSTLRPPDAGSGCAPAPAAAP